MKFLLIAAAVVAVAVAGPTRALVQPGIAGPAPIIDGGLPISVGPAIIDGFEPIAIGPAIIDNFEPISVGPAIIDFPLPESALAPTPAAPAPVAPAPEASSPLVQIIVNVNQAQDGPAVGSPVVVDNIPTPQVPVTGVEGAILPNPAPIIPGPVIVPNPPIFPTPVNVAEQPKPVEPVNVAPIIVAPAVIAPEILN